MLIIEASGLDDIKDAFQGMRRRAGELSPAWEVFLDWWAESNTEHFTSRGRRWRTPWRPLAPSTVRQKREQGFLGDPLVRSTRMRAELTGRPLGSEHITGSVVEAGTNIPYARFHQRGAPRARLPRRQLVNADAVAAEGAAGSAVLTWIVHGDANTGGGLRLEG